jgi:hypothetical protein
LKTTITKRKNRWENSYPFVATLRRWRRTQQQTTTSMKEVSFCWMESSGRSDYDGQRTWLESSNTSNHRSDDNFSIEFCKNSHTKTWNTFSFLFSIQYLTGISCRHVLLVFRLECFSKNDFVVFQPLNQKQKNNTKSIRSLIPSQVCVIRVHFLLRENNNQNTRTHTLLLLFYFWAGATSSD